MNTTASAQALLAKWEKLAASLADGYGFDLDNWLNDVDVRRLLAEAIAKADAAVGKTLQARQRAADALVRRATEPTSTCLWGSKNAAKHGYDADQHWFYFAVPKQRCREFEQDLARVR